MPSISNDLRAAVTVAGARKLLICQLHCDCRDRPGVRLAAQSGVVVEWVAELAVLIGVIRSDRRGLQ